VPFQKLNGGNITVVDLINQYAGHEHANNLFPIKHRNGNKRNEASCGTAYFDLGDVIFAPHARLEIFPVGVIAARAAGCTGDDDAGAVQGKYIVVYGIPLYQSCHIFLKLIGGHPPKHHGFYGRMKHNGGQIQLRGGNDKADVLAQALSGIEAFGNGYAGNDIGSNTAAYVPHNRRSHNDSAHNGYYQFHAYCYKMPPFLHLFELYRILRQNTCFF